MDLNFLGAWVKRETLNHTDMVREEEENHLMRKTNALLVSNIKKKLIKALNTTNMKQTPNAFLFSVTFHKSQEHKI